MAKPVYSTGDVPTADEVNDWFVNVLWARTLATQSVTSSTTLQDDDYMFVSVDANAEYHVECMVTYGGAAAGDLKMLFRTPAGATFTGMATAIVSTGASQQDIQTMQYAGNSSEVWGTLGSGQQYGIVHGALVTVGTAGTFKVEWAQNTSNATATQIFTNSYLKLTRMV